MALPIAGAIGGKCGFAHAFGAARTVGMGRFHEQRFEFAGMVEHRRQEIVEERAVDRLAVVVAYFFEQRRAQAGERRAFILQTALERMDRLADIDGAGDLQDADFAGLGVDFDLGAGG